MASRELIPSLRSAASAKSIIMIAFFLTMPISRIIPIMPMMSRLLLNRTIAISAPTPADGSVEMMVSGWIRLSYRMPSTIYTASSAVPIRIG